MLGDSLSTSTHHVVLGKAASLASAVFAGTHVMEASAAFSRVEAAGCRESVDCSSISSPMSMVAGITEAAAAMMMRSPTQACSRVFDNSPLSVLEGPGVDTPSPIASGNSIFVGVQEFANFEGALNDASSRNSQVGTGKPSQSDISDSVESFRAPLLRIRTFRRPPLSEESAVAGRNGQSRWKEKCKSSESINRDEEDGEAEVQGKVEVALKVPEEAGQEDDEPESPTTPCSIPKPLILECPDAPCIRSRELARQSSLRDTKLLMTTHLKRSASIFMFDKHFEFLREIGRGSFSTVYEARDRRSGLHFAVKMSKRQFRGREDRDDYLREIQSVSCLSEHGNVVKYYRSWQQDSHFYIQMELCESGSLRTLLDSSTQPLLEDQVWNFIKQVASGLEHIHAQGVLHLDIKPENIFVDSQGVLKIGDFGLAVPRRLWDWEEGDGGYVAPELLREEEPGPEADMYSFGAMLYEWATGSKLPRSGPLREGLVELPATRSKALDSLVRALLSPNPSKRPGARDVINWIKD